MRICIIDDKLYENGTEPAEIIRRLQARHGDNLEMTGEFFPSCFSNGKKNDEAIKEELDSYDAIIYHNSSFGGRGKAFRDILKASGKRCELIAFSGSIPHLADFHPDYNFIMMPRDPLYAALETFVNSAFDRGELDLNQLSKAN